MNMEFAFCGKQFCVSLKEKVNGFVIVNNKMRLPLCLNIKNQIWKMKRRWESSERFYPKDHAPQEFINAFIWWAYQSCPNQKHKTLPCGAPEVIFNEAHLTLDCRDRITRECNEFWVLARKSIYKAKGRCNWNPTVDSDRNHIGQCGSNFFFARRDNLFFMETWPRKERAEFCGFAKNFGPMFVREEKERLIFVEGHPPKDAPCS